jgi:hypothetical protein
MSGLKIRRHSKLLRQGHKQGIKRATKNNTKNMSLRKEIHLFIIGEHHFHVCTKNCNFFIHADSYSLKDARSK